MTADKIKELIETVDRVSLIDAFVADKNGTLSGKIKVKSGGNVHDT